MNTLSTSQSKHLCLLLLVFTYLFPITLAAQTRRYIKSHEYMTELEKQDTSLIRKRAALEVTVKGTYKTVKVSSNPVIPIIFHILYDTESKRVSETAIHAQLSALNRDYGFTNNGFAHESLDQDGFAALSNPIGIQFCLPEFSGDSTAINYYPIGKVSWDFDNSMKDPNREGVAPWNPQQFLNVYVVDMTDNLAVSGYAQMPGGADTTDGIVIDYQFIAEGTAPYDLGRTLVHLVGNWMGLYSIWGAEPCDKNGDFVEDTPAHNSPNFGCPVYQHVSSCYSNRLVVEQSMNFMDSSDDACLSLFTTGQKYRFYAFLQAARSGIIKHNYNCSSPNINTSPTETGSIDRAGDTYLLLSDQVKVYPNPSRDYLQISLSLANQDLAQLQVHDLNGRLLLERNQLGDKEHIQLVTSDWQVGMYILTVLQNGKVIHSEKIAIQR